MSKLYENIDALCLKYKINITTMCKEAGVSRASLTDLKNGRIQKLSADTLTKIADYFGVSIDHLLGKKNKPAGITDELDPIYFSLAKNAQESQLDPDDIKEIIALVKRLGKNRKKED